MESTARRTKAIRFGPFEADAAGERLLRNGRPVRIQEQPLKLLFLLIEHAGEIVTREEMRARLWPTDSFGDFDNGVNVAVRKLRAALGDDSDRPRFIETVPRRGYRFIAEIDIELEAAVEPFPIAQTVVEPIADGQVRDEVSASLAVPVEVSSKVELAPQPVEPKRHSRNLRILAFALTALAAGIVGAIFLGHRHLATSRPESSSGSGNGRRSIAVLTFRNSSGRSEDAWLSSALAEMFSTELAAGDHLRLVDGEDVVHARLAQPSLDVDSVSAHTARQLRNALGADILVSGSYSTISSGDTRQVRLDVRLQDAATGEILTEVSGDATEPTLFHTVGQVGERLRQRLGVGSISAEEHEQVLASMPKSREAGELYSQGLLKLRAYDALAARDLLAQSVAAEPSFPLSHAALSQAWSRLGYDQRARDEAHRAFDLSAGLPLTDRLRVQARYWEATGNWDKAAQSYQTLQSSFPDDPEYRILLAGTLTQAGKGKAALDLLRASSAEPRDPAIDLKIAEALYALGDDLRGSVNAAQAAATAAKARGQLLLLARALYTQGRALEGLALYDDAISATDQGRSIYEHAGDRLGLASILEVQGNILSDRGQLPAALDKYRQELAIVREVGNKRGEASALNNIALVLDQQGDLDHSRAMWEQAATAFREVGDKSNTSVVLVNIAGALKDQGDLAAAKRNCEEALSLARSNQDDANVVLATKALGTVLDAQGDFKSAEEMLRDAASLDKQNGHAPASADLINLGDLLRHKGQLAASRDAYNEALTSSQANSDKSNSAYARFGLGRLACLANDLEGARANYNEALRVRSELNEPFTVEETEMALAEIQLEQGHASEAEASFRKSRDLFAKATRRDDAATASALLASALLAQGKAAEADLELNSLPSNASIQSIEPRLALMIAQGRTLFAMGKAAQAKALLQKALNVAQSAGFAEYMLEARLASLETGSPSAQRNAKTQLLASDAAQAGYKLIQTQALRLLPK